MNIYVVKDKLQKEMFIIAKAIFAEIHLSSTPLNLFNDSLHISSTSLTKLASGASLRLMMVMLLVLMMRMGMIEEGDDGDVDEEDGDDEEN